MSGLTGEPPKTTRPGPEGRGRRRSLTGLVKAFSAVLQPSGPRSARLPAAAGQSTATDPRARTKARALDGFKLAFPAPSARNVVRGPRVRRSPAGLRRHRSSTSEATAWGFPTGPEVDTWPRREARTPTGSEGQSSHINATRPLCSTRPEGERRERIKGCEFKVPPFLNSQTVEQPHEKEPIIVHAERSRREGGLRTTLKASLPPGVTGWCK
jgi:hypothetical protein